MGFGGTKVGQLDEKAEIFMCFSCQIEFGCSVYHLFKVLFMGLFYFALNILSNKIFCVRSLKKNKSYCGTNNQNINGLNPGHLYLTVCENCESSSEALPIFNFVKSKIFCSYPSRRKKKYDYYRENLSQKDRTLKPEGACALTLKCPLLRPRM